MHSYPDGPASRIIKAARSYMLQLHQGGAHVETMVCLALLFAMNAMALASLTHNAQISLMIWMTTVNSSAMH